MPENHIMLANFKYGILKIGSRDCFGSLTDLFIIGNQYRAGNGVAFARPDLYLNLSCTKDYIQHLVKNENIPDPIKTKKGKGGGTWAHLYVLVDAAMYLSPELKTEVIKKFVHERLLQIRNDTSDNFIELNAQVALSAQEIFGKPSHNGHYINLAKIIKSRVLEEGQEWNNSSSNELMERDRIETALTVMLKCNVVRDWEHLKELAAKV